MTPQDFQTVLHYLNRVTVRGFEEEQELVKLVAKLKAQTVRNDQSTNVYTNGSTKAA